MAKPKSPPLSHYLKEEVPICISFCGGVLKADPDTAEVDFSKNERVHWFLCGDAAIAAIDFKTSPFSGAIEFHPKMRHALSGTVSPSLIEKMKKSGRKSMPFKYTVTVKPAGSSKLVSLDPIVIVMP